jgi:hypothetical protein
MTPSMMSERMQRIKVSFLKLKKMYLLLAIGMRKIDKNEPTMAPMVRHPIRKPFASGGCIHGP